MRILIVSPYLPHPESGHGTGVFMYEFLSHLGKHFDVTLLSFCDEKEVAFIGDLQKIGLRIITISRKKCRQPSFIANMRLAIQRFLQIINSLVLWQPYNVAKWNDSRMSNELARLLKTERFDIVQFEFSFMGQYLAEVYKEPTIVHAHDVTYRVAYRRYRSANNMFAKAIRGIEFCRWTRFEREVFRKCNRVIAVTNQDKNLVEWLTKDINATYLPRAINTPAEIPSYTSRQPMTLLFVGSFYHQPNVNSVKWICNEIFPLVSHKYPSISIDIVGDNPPREIKLLSQKDSRIRVLGFVSDVNRLFQTKSIFIAPLKFGGGIKLKIIHAMAHGIPVVTTKIGVEGIEGKSGEDFLLGESSEDLADKITMLLSDNEMAAKIGIRGWRIVTDNYSWSQSMYRIESTFEELQITHKTI